MDYHNLPRKQLQALCKKHEIPANQTNVQMADALTALLKVETNPKSGAGKKQAAAKEDVRDESSVLTENSNVPKVKATRSKRQETKDVGEEDCEQFAASAEDGEGDGEDKTANKRAKGSHKLRSKSQKDDKDEVVVVDEVEKPRTRGARGEKTGKVSEPDITGVEKVAAKKTDNTNKKNPSADDNCDVVARDHSEEEQGFKREATLQGKVNRSRQLRHLPKKVESIEHREHKVIDVAEAEEDDEVDVVEEAVKSRHRGSHSERAGKGTEPDISGLEVVGKKTDTKKKNVSELDIAKDCREDNRGKQLRHLRKKAASVGQSEDKVVNISLPEEDVVEQAMRPRRRGACSEKTGKGTEPDINVVEKVNTVDDKKNASEDEKAKDCSKGHKVLKDEAALQGKDNEGRQLRHLRKKTASVEQFENKVVNVAQSQEDYVKADDHNDSEQGLKGEAALKSKDNGGRQLRHSRNKAAFVEESENKVLNVAQTEKHVQEEIVMKVDKKKNASEGANVHERADDHNECEQGLKGETTSQGKYNDGRQMRHLRRKPESANESVDKMVDAAEPEVRVSSKRTTRANASKITQNSRPAITTKAAVKSSDEEEENNSNTSESICKNKTTNVQKLEKSPVVIDLVDSDDDEDLEEKEDMSEQSTVFVPSKNADTKKAGKGIGKMMPCQTNLRARQSKVSVEIHANISEAHKHVMSSRGHKSGKKEEALVNGCAKGRNESEATVNPSTSVKQVITRRRGKGGHKEELVDPSSVEDKVEAVGVSDEITVAKHKETLIASAEEQKDAEVAVSVEPAVNHVITRRGRKGCQESHASNSTKELKNNATDIYVENIVDASESSKKVVTRRLHKSGHIMQEVVNFNKLDKVAGRGCNGGQKEESLVNISSEESKFDAVEEAKNKKIHTVNASESPKRVVTRRGRRGVHNEDEAVNVNNVGCRGRNGRKKEVNASAQEDKDVAAEVNASAQSIVNPSDFTKQVATQRGRKGCQEELLVNTSPVEEKNNGADHSVEESVNATIEKDMTNVAQKKSTCEADESDENTKMKGIKAMNFSTDDNINEVAGSISKRDTEEITYGQLDAECVVEKEAKFCGDAEEGLGVSSNLIGEVYSNSDKDVVEGICISMPLEESLEECQVREPLETMNAQGSEFVVAVESNINEEREKIKLVDIEEEENPIKDEKNGDEMVISTIDNGAFQTLKYVEGDDMVEDEHSERELGGKFVSPDCTVEVGEVSEIEEIDDGESLMGGHRDFENDNLGESFDPVKEESESMGEKSDSSCEFGEDESSDSAFDQEDEETDVEQKILDLDGCPQPDDLLLDGHKSQNISSETDNDDEDSSKSYEEDCDSDLSEEIDHEESSEIPFTDWQNDRLGLENETGTNKLNYYDVIKDPEEESGVTVSNASRQLDNLRVKDQVDEHKELENREESAVEGCTLVSGGFQDDSAAKDEAYDHNVKGSSSCHEGNFNEKHSDFHIDEEICHEKNIEISLAGLQSDKYSSEDETDDGKSSHADSFNGSDTEKEVPVLHPCKQNDSVVKDEYHEHEPRCSSSNEEDEELYYSDSEEFEHEEKIDASETGMPNDGMLPEDEADDSEISVDSDNEETLLARKQIEDKTRELEGSEESGTLYDKSHESAQNDSDVREELYAEASDKLESQIQQPSKTMDSGALLTEEDEIVETTTEVRTPYVEMYDLFRNVSSDNMLCDIIPEVRDQNNKIYDLLDSKVSSFAEIHREKIGDTDTIDEQHTCISAPDELPGKEEEDEAEQSDACTKKGNTTEVGSVYNGDSDKELAKVEENAVEASCSDLKIKVDEPGSYESHDPGKVKYCEVEGDTNVILFSGLYDDSPNNQGIQEEFSSSSVVGEVQLTEENSITMDEIRSISTEKINEFTHCTKVFHCSAMTSIEQSPKILSTELDISRCDSLLKMSYSTEGHDWSPCLNSLFVDEFVATSENVELGLSESKDTNPCSDLNESVVEDCQDTISTEACKLEFGKLKDPELSSDTEVFHCSDGSAMEQSEEEVVVTEPFKPELVGLDSPCSDMDVAAIEERQQVILSQPCKHELSESDTPLKMSETPKGYDMTCLNSSYDMTQMQPDLKSNANLFICSGMNDYAIEESEEFSPKQSSKLDFSQIDSPSKISDYTEGYEISPSLSSLCSLLKKLKLGSRTDVPTFSGVDDSVIEQNREVLPTEACNVELSEFSTTSGMAKLTKDNDVSPSLKITADVLFFSGINDSMVKQRQEVSPADVCNQELSPFGTTLMMTESPKGYGMSPCLNTLFAEESGATIKMHEPKNVIDSLIRKQAHVVAIEVCEQELSPFGNTLKNTLFVEEFCPSTEIVEPAENTDSLIEQSQEVVAPEIDSPMKMPELIKGYEKSPCLSTLFVDEFGTSLKMADPTNQNNSVNEKSQTVFPIEQKMSPGLNFQPTKRKIAELTTELEMSPCLNTLFAEMFPIEQDGFCIKQSEEVNTEEVCEQERSKIDTHMKMAELTTELEMSPCLNTLFAEMPSTPSKMPEPTSSIDVLSASSGVDDSSLLQINQILPTEACKHEISQISPHSHSAFEQSSGTSMGKPEHVENNNLFDCAGMFDASEQSIEILATEVPKRDAYEQEHSKIDTPAKMAEFTKELEMSPCLNTLFAEVSSTPKMPEPTSSLDVSSPSLGVDDSSLLEMNEILPRKACKHETHSKSVFEESFGTPVGKPELAENNNVFDCVGMYDAAEQRIEILETEASKQDACEQKRSIFDTPKKMAELNTELEMSPCLNTLFAEVSSTGLSSPSLEVDDSSLQDLNEILVADACKREICQISPRSNAIFEESSGSSMEIFSTEASRQDHYELDSPMKKGQPTEGQELSACLNIPSGQDSNSSKKSSKMDEACEKDLDCIQEPSQVNISSGKPQLTEGFGKLERSDVRYRSSVAEIMETEIQSMDERESEQSLLPEFSADHVQFADGDTCSGNVAAAGKESKPTSRIMERLANLRDRLQGMQKDLEGQIQPSSYCTPARRLKPSQGNASAKRVRETMSVSRSRLSVKSDKEAFMKENPNDFTQHSFQQLKSLAKEKEMKPKDFEKSVTKRAALKNLSSNALERRTDSVGKPFPSDERTLTIHEDQCS